MQKLQNLGEITGVKVIEKKHIDAARQFKSHPSITIRQADKAATFLIINDSEYHEETVAILSDTNKFTRINRDPTEALKKLTIANSEGQH